MYQELLHLYNRFWGETTCSNTCDLRELTLWKLDRNNPKYSTAAWRNLICRTHCDLLKYMPDLTVSMVVRFGRLNVQKCKMESFWIWWASVQKVFLFCPIPRAFWIRRYVSRLVASSVSLLVAVGQVAFTYPSLIGLNIWAIQRCLDIISTFWGYYIISSYYV